jgi:hypothetical protein
MHIHCGDWAGARGDLDRVRAAGVPVEKELIVISNLLDNQVA